MQAFGLLLSVVLLDIILSGDNAVVVASVASHVRPNERDTAINVGMMGAALMRVIFLFCAVVFLSFSWLAKLGGLVLVVIALKLAVDILRGGDAPNQTHPHPTALWSAIVSIMLADVSLSFDNVMAVGGLAHGNAVVMVLGVLLSIALLTKATHWIARVLQRFRWLQWAGVALILLAAYRLVVP